MGWGLYQDISSPAGDRVLDVTRWTGGQCGAIRTVPKAWRGTRLLRGVESRTCTAEISGPKPGGFETPRAPRLPPTPVECSMVCVGWKQAGHVDS